MSKNICQWGEENSVMKNTYFKKNILVSRGRSGQTMAWGPYAKLKLIILLILLCVLFSLYVTPHDALQKH